MTRSELLPEIFKLSEQEQFMIAEAIRDRLQGGPAPVDEEEFKRELDRRIADAEAHPEDQLPLETAVARIRASL